MTTQPDPARDADTAPAAAAGQDPDEMAAVTRTLARDDAPSDGEAAGSHDMGDAGAPASSMQRERPGSDRE